MTEETQLAEKSRFSPQGRLLLSSITFLFVKVTVEIGTQIELLSRKLCVEQKILYH